MKNESIIYFGGAIPVDIEKEVARVDLVPHMASQKFSWSVNRALLRGFDAVYNISSCDICNYPAGAQLIFHSRSFIRNDVPSFFVGFINLIVLKHLSRMMALLVLTPLVTIRQRAGYMLVHGTHTPFMMAAILTKLLFRVRIAILLTDKHGVAVPSDGWAGSFFRSIDTWLMRFLLNRFDVYICLSPTFITKFGLRKVFVVPGILSEDFKVSLAVNKGIQANSEFFDIVFAGGVSIENGIDKLIRAFGLVANPRVRLFVYGAGTLVRDVEAAGLSDSRIHYGGVLHGDALTAALLAASLLINPRPVGDEYAHTSFPSKLIEYMATGIPTLTTRLVGIPDQLKECFYFIEGDSEENIAQAMIDVLNVLPCERSKKGSFAAEMVSSLYSEETFGRRTRELMRTNFEKKG